MRSSIAASNAKLAAMTALLNGGVLRIYDGTRPTGPDTAITSQVLLAELALNATAFGTPSNRVATANAITSDTSANATGTATWARAFASGGTTAHYDMSAGVGSGELQLSAHPVSGVTVAITAWTLTDPIGT